MSFGLAELQAFLSAWPVMPCPQGVTCDSLMERILQILKAGVSWREVSGNDLLPLLRHLLLSEMAKTGYEQHLRVPSGAPWPTVNEWDSHCVSAMPVGTDALLLTATAWHPAWLGGGEDGVFADAYSEKIVRVDGRCPADQFITDATGRESYTCPGQREAVRAAFLMSPGHTLLVNLPTGSGKSLVGQAPALVHRDSGKLTLFVVPTVALAIDQARQMRMYFSRTGNYTEKWPLAWHGGTSDSDRMVIRRRMLDGTQRILFTSPEALTTSLLRTVFEVARNGLIQYLVIDEAHLVTQWGDQFRPAFQALAGLRNSLLRQVKEQPFRTLLLSATFTQETVETLATLFGPPERVQMVSAVHLRPEPQYWFSRATSPTDKEERILEALRHAPRPFILYVTTREDSLRWQRLLADRAKYRRVERFDGETPDRKREQIINDWVANRVDGVVATSAFGVGIDKDDVRTVIHASIPETLDRFYQEVGRGGRNGMPSVSLLVFDDSDWKVPTGLAAPTIISNEIGFSRWRSLYDSRESVDLGLPFKVNIEAVREGLKGSNDENVKWNMRTLLLMCRAGFLELDIDPNEPVDQNAGEYSTLSPLAAMAVIRIRTLRDDHLLTAAWEQIVSPSREKTLKAGARSLRLMQSLLNDGGEVAATLAELYSIHTPAWSVDVTQVCGGCPSDRFDSGRQTRYHVPIAAPIQDTVRADLKQWKSTFPYLDPTYSPIFYNPETPTALIMNFIRWLVGSCGVQEVCADERSALSRLSEWRNLYRHASSGAVLHRDCRQLDEEPYSPLARITFLDSRVTSQEIEKVLLLERPLHLVLLPINTPDPMCPNRRLADMATNSMRLEQLNEVISQ